MKSMYLFDKNPAFSVSKYFTLAVHDTIKSSLFFEAYFPSRGNRCYEWRLNIEESPPSDWLQSLTLGGKMLTDACEAKNLIDIHTVFDSYPLLKIEWANGKLQNNDSKVCKPDFLVYSLSGSVKHVLLISEFKATDQNSYVKSDLVKLAKQMRFTLNDLKR